MKGWLTINLASQAQARRNSLLLLSTSQHRELNSPAVLRTFCQGSFSVSARPRLYPCIFDAPRARASVIDAPLTLSPSGFKSLESLLRRFQTLELLLLAGFAKYLPLFDWKPESLCYSDSQPSSTAMPRFQSRRSFCYEKLATFCCALWS